MKSNFSSIYVYLSGVTLFILSTGLVGNYLALLLIPLIFPLRISIDRYLLIFISLLMSIGIVGILSGEHTAIRALLFPIALGVTYMIGRQLPDKSIAVFAFLVLFEICIATPMWLAGVFSPFPFVDTPFDNPSYEALSTYVLYWKTAGLSANTSLFALKLIVLFSVRERLPIILRKYFFLYYVIIALTTSRTLFISSMIYFFIRLRWINKIYVAAFTCIAVILNIELVIAFGVEQFFRGYSGVIDSTASLEQNDNRFVFWFYGVQQVLMNPLLGSMGDSVFFIQSNGEGARLHSVFLQLAADYGVFSLMVWCVFLWKYSSKLGYAALPIILWQAMNQSYLGVFAFGDLMLMAVCFGASIDAKPFPRMIGPWRIYDRQTA